jgi:hypothetical protein
MTTEELLQELKAKLERLQILEEALASIAATPSIGKKTSKGKGKRKPWTAERKAKAAAAKKTWWAKKRKAENTPKQ